LCRHFYSIFLKRSFPQNDVYTKLFTPSKPYDGYFLHLGDSIPYQLELFTQGQLMKKFFTLASLFLVPLFLSMGAMLLMIFVFGAYRSIFSFPWGDDGSYYPVPIRDLVIYNTTQLIFLTLVFLAALYFYNRSIKKQLNSSYSKTSILIAALSSWIIYNINALATASFFCCPGLFPEVFNAWYWMTYPEFVVFTIVGAIYIWWTTNNDSQ